ncbi:MAG: peptidoglycan DD-metalloendopeptidase family protein [Halofilum sp. (in: g-proteobacteria)]
MNTRPLLLAALLALTGCAGSGLTGDAFRPAVHVVRAGDTLYSIAWRHGLDHRELARWNDLDSPDHLRVGQRLRLSSRGPVAASDRSTSAPTRQSRTTAQRESQAESRSAPAESEESAKESSKPVGDEPGAWRWPAGGELIGEFGGDGVAGRGIEIAGEMGAAVKASAGGEVVYSGEGLQAYGQLVIIRHGGGFLSAYAHNDRLLVDEGQQVVAGQQIAGMGRTNDGDVLLHFEIRRQGTPVDPLDFLPARE